MRATILALLALALSGCGTYWDSDTAQGRPLIVVHDDGDAGVRCYVWTEGSRGGISCVRVSP